MRGSARTLAGVTIDCTIANAEITILMAHEMTSEDVRALV
jgi:hypothetical protein